MKIYIIIGLGIVFCLVGYYRFFSHRSSENAAAQTAAPSPSPAAPAAVVEVRSPEVPNGTAGGEPSQDVVRDIFEAPKIARAGDGKLQGIGPGAQSGTPLVLNGMISSGSTALAIINGQFERVGDQVAGYKVVRIGARDVLLKGEDREITLRVVEYGQK